MATASIGAMRERLMVVTPEPAALSVSSINHAAGVVTVTTNEPHGYQTDDYVTIAGVTTPAALNGRYKVTVTGASTFTYVLAGALGAGSGTITATYVSDAQGGRRIRYRTVASNVAAEHMVMGANERLQFRALQSQVDYRFRIHTRSDLAAKMRVLWRPSWEASAVQRELEIAAIVPFDDGRQFALVECRQVA